MPAPATISKSISGFDPRSVAGCQLWLDASDTSSLTGSSPVTAWRNKGLSGNNATYAGTPSISATAINGRQAIYFNGSSYFTGAISAASTTTITIFMVGSLISPFTGFSGLLCFGNASQLDYDNVGSLPITMYNADFAIYGARNSSSQITPISANVPFLYVLQYDGTYINTWLNGTQQTNPSTNIASSGTFTYTNYSVSCRAGTITGQYIWTGYFGEILVYQSALTTTERQKVEGYLSWKWGLQNISQNFTPTSISGCLLWLDGADQSTNSMTLSGTSVSLWKDKTGNSTMTLGGTAPTLSTGPTGVYFPGTGYYSTTYTASPVNETLFIVFNTNSTLYTGYAPIIGASASGSRSFSLQNGSAILGYLSDGVAWGTITTFTIGTITLAEGTYTGSTESVTINGGSFVTGSQSFTAGRTSQIGASQGIYFFKGWIYEIIAYNSVLSTAQRQQVEIYLSRKWGVSVSTNALSLSHPFSSIRPFSRYFNPIDIQSCQLWLDAADSSTTGGGSTLSTWLDKSGNGNTATSGSGTIAVSSTGLTFNGSTNYMTVAGLAGALANTSFVVFVVETLTGSGGYYFGDDNVNNGGSTDSSLHIGYRSQTNQTFAFYSDDLEDYSVSGSNIRRVWTLWLPTGANRVTRRNGAVDVTLGNSNRLLSFTAPRIGRVFGGNYYPGIISEILVYTTDIGLQNVLPIEGYLAWKWGLQASLPATHPYKQFPPSSALPFSPTNISNCQLWMDATQDTSANNATITTILDRSGNGTNLTAIGTITFYQNYRNGNPVYYFGGTRASNANFDWGTNFTHIVVSSSGSGGWLNSAGTLTTYVGLGNWALANINATISFEDPGSITTWNISGSVTTGVNANGLPYVTLPVSTSSGSATSTYTTPINSVRQTSFSLVLPSTAGLYSYFGLTNGTTTLQFLLNTSGGVPSQIYFFFGGNPTLNASAGSTVLCTITNTSLYMIVYPSGSNVTVSWTNSGAAEYYMFFNVIGNGANANTTTYSNIQFDPAQGGSILPKTTGLATAWNITSVGYTSGSTTLTNYAVNGITRSSWTSTAYSGQTPVLPLYINGSSTGAYDSTYYAEIIHYNVALSTAQRQQVEGYLAAKWGISLPTTHPYRNFQPAQTSFVIITPGTIATVTLSALSGSGGTITWTTSTNAVSYKWYVGTTYPTALTSGTVGAVLTTSVSYAFIASTNYYAWVIPVSSTGTDGATTQSAAASYSAGGGITVSSSGTAADMTAAANTISGSFAGVDDSFGQLPCISFGINGTSGYTTAYVGTNGYITFASGQGNIPSANNPGVPSIPAIKIRGFDSRGISCTYASGSKPSNANITYTRIVGNWYPYYGVNAGLIPLEIFLVRDATATKQYIWIKIGSSYNNNGYSDSDWAVTNGSSYLVSVAYPGAGTSIVFESSGFTGASWTATSPGSLVGLLT